ncbi:protocadherin gamma-B4-like [Rana temporaria]|uniref:protocadherin gamma-B4-like n=1 Tax=Rana temporaria TaxID=8407 RepID=UPI001AAC5EA5|nr:protocadherin gamma-B4-like [Rana temporaria]
MENMARQVIFLYFSFCFVAASDFLHYSVLEEIKQNSVVGNVANDLKLTSNELKMKKLRIVSNKNMNYFNISSENGNIYIISRIDREELCGSEMNCFLDLEILAENPVNVYPVRIEIQDVNDNPPSFSKDIFYIGISESTSPGARFVLGNALDQDSGSNSLQSYELSPNTDFELVEKPLSEEDKYLELILKQQLDREKQQRYRLILTASDGGKPVKTGTAIIQIEVQDVNDNYPVFSQKIYRIDLNENSAPGSLVIDLNATDEDEGSNAHITYSFSHIRDNARQVFSLDSQTGVIKTIQELDYESARSYEATVEAKDGGGLAAQCTVFIQIVDINDNAPEITLASLYTPVPEDSPPGTLVALINVKDLDAGKNGEVVCQIRDTQAFKLMASSNNYYKLITARLLDREENPWAILDVNDNPPMFSKPIYVSYIPEHAPAGTSILNVYASDLDEKENARITYSIINTIIENIPVSSYISMNSMTGVIYAQRSFDYEQLQELQFQLMAKDSGSPPLSTNVTVRICIIDKNDNAPKILYPSPDNEDSTIFEFIPNNAEKGYLVTKVIAVDADSGHNAWLSYHLLQVPDPTLINIGQHSGEIRIGRDLQYTDSLRQKIVVLVKDSGQPSLSSTVTLSLVVAENFQEVVPEIKHTPSNIDISSNATFYLIIAIVLISVLFIVSVMIVAIFKCKKSTATTLGTYRGNVYPQFTLGCPSEISDTSLPFPFSYDVCVTLDSKQNEIAYLKPVQNVPTDNLIDTGDSPSENTTQI